MEEFISNEKFIGSPDFSLIPINPEISIKSNEYIASKNFISIVLQFKQIREFLKYIQNLIDVENLVKNVLNNIQTEKTKLPVNVDIGISEFNSIKIGDTTYKVLRLDNYTIEISNLTNSLWNVDSLMVQCKNFEGMLVYPVITTAMNKVKLYFSDGISTNYNVFIL